MNEAVAVNEKDMTARIVYILYLAGIVVGITGIVGVVMAYVNRGEASAWLKSHYTFQIRTFWIGLLYLFIGALTSVILVGWLVILFWLVWLIVRCVKGLQMLDKKQPMANVDSWMFG